MRVMFKCRASLKFQSSAKLGWLGSNRTSTTCCLKWIRSLTHLLTFQWSTRPQYHRLRWTARYPMASCHHFKRPRYRTSSSRYCLPTPISYRSDYLQLTYQTVWFKSWGILPIQSASQETYWCTTLQHWSCLISWLSIWQRSACDTSYPTYLILRPWFSSKCSRLARPWTCSLPSDLDLNQDSQTNSLKALLRPKIQTSGFLPSDRWDFKNDV